MPNPGASVRRLGDAQSEVGAGDAEGAAARSTRLSDRTQVERPVLDGDDDLTFGVPLPEVGDGLGSPAQRVRAADDRGQLPGFHELLQD